MYSLAVGIFGKYRKPTTYKYDTPKTNINIKIIMNIGSVDIIGKLDDG